jgi:hypothetical protein
VCVFNYISKVAKISGDKKNFRKKFGGDYSTRRWRLFHREGALAAADAALGFSFFFFL